MAGRRGGGGAEGDQGQRGTDRPGRRHGRAARMRVRALTPGIHSAHAMCAHLRRSAHAISRAC
eukprot:2851860-Pleurochrysis_carterae.AAC.1